MKNTHTFVSSADQFTCRHAFVLPLFLVCLQQTGCQPLIVVRHSICNALSSCIRSVTCYFWRTRHVRSMQPLMSMEETGYKDDVYMCSSGCICDQGYSEVRIHQLYRPNCYAKRLWPAGLSSVSLFDITAAPTVRGCSFQHLTASAIEVWFGHCDGRIGISPLRSWLLLFSFCRPSFLSARSFTTWSPTPNYTSSIGHISWTQLVCFCFHFIATLLTFRPNLNRRSNRQLVCDLNCRPLHSSPCPSTLFLRLSICQIRV